MLKHLIELRQRLLYSLLFLGGCFLLFFFYSKPALNMFVYPLQRILPKGSELIATDITSSVMTPMKLSFDLALISSLPFAFYQFWRFAAPGLYCSERKKFIVLMITSLALFIAGLMFCFFIVLPFMFGFFSQFLPEGIRLMPDMRLTVDFMFRMLLVFALCFQLPLICVAMNHSGLLNHRQLKQARPYVIVSAFIVGMLLTPPDVVSQIMLAVPLCLLYELGLLMTQASSN